MTSRTRIFSVLAVSVSALFVASSIQGAGAITNPAGTVNAIGLAKAASVSYAASTNSESSSASGALPSARDYIGRHAAAWKIDPTQLRFDRVVQTGDGQKVVRFNQYFGEVQVYASLVSITLDAQNHFLAVNISVAALPSAQAPSYSVDDATRALATAAAAKASVTTDAVKVTSVVPVFIDSQLSPEMPAGQYFAWRGNTYATGKSHFGNQTLVADKSGAFIKQVSLADSVTNNVTPDPLVCDMSQARLNDYLNVPGNGGILGTTESVSFFQSVATDDSHVRVALGPVGSSFLSSDLVSVSGLNYPFDGVFQPEGSVNPSSPTPYITYVATVPAGHSADYVYGLQQVSGVMLSRFGGSQRVMSLDSSSFPLCGNGYQGQGVSSTTTAAQNIRDTVTFYKTVLNTNIDCVEYLGNISDSINGTSPSSPGAKCGMGDATNGALISAFVNVCTLSNGSADTCPLQNAFWVPWWSNACGPSDNNSCSGIFMGQGMDRVQDVIAHELTHGVSYAVAFTGSAAMNPETDAMSEGLSDIFGKSVDLLNVTNSDAADPNWNIGVGAIPGQFPDGFRNMRGVTDTHQGGALGASCNDYSWLPIPAITSTWDPNCEMHTMNGPLNRFAYILANGDTASGVAALGLHPDKCSTVSLSAAIASCTGIVRMDKLIFKAMSSGMTSSSTYWDFARATATACNALVVSNTDGFTTSTCANVGKALRVTGISGVTLSNVTGVTALNHSVGQTFMATVKTLTNRSAKSIPATLQYAYYNSKLKKWVWVTSRTSTVATNGVVTFDSVKIPAKVSAPKYKGKVYKYSVTKYMIGVNALNGGSVVSSRVYTISVK